eukprot:425744_1
MLNNNKNGIENINQFVSLHRKQFARIITQETKKQETCTKIKLSVAARLFRLISNKLIKKAQTEQYGEFLYNLDSHTIDQDYHHIFKSHILNGDKITIENTFRWFNKIGHYEDGSSEIEQCRSIKRREQRANSVDAIDKKKEDDIKKKEPDEDNATITWSLKQYYMQSTMDIIHSYLVHSDYKYFIKRYTNQTDELQKTDTKLHDADLSIAHDKQKTSKYVTNGSSDETMYKLGIDMSHPHLKPKYSCLKDELLCNEFWPLTLQQFDRLLIKAINMHQIALIGDYKHELICKYYDYEYNIIRNDPIGIKHILSIIIYTDMSHFCSAYRKTYRRIEDETTDEQVTNRHIQLYNYARCLLEAVEFFGEEMDAEMKVFHGLDKVMNFHKFTAYFNQPISTSKSFRTAQMFSKGIGIILGLQSGSELVNNTCKIPKYLSVSFLSSFPNEDEKLFYGSSLRFKIYNIIEAETNKGHLKEMLMLNNFQKMLNNQTVEWNKQSHKMIDRLVMLMQQQIIKNRNRQNKEEKKYDSTAKINNKSITKYGRQLFTYFCDKTNITNINDYKSLPQKLRSVLFVDDQNNHFLLSLMPITNVFINLKEIRLNELNIQQFTKDAKHNYINAVLDYITNSSKPNVLEKIIFQSEKQEDRRTNSTLNKLANAFSNKFSKYKWSIKYTFELETNHILVFTNNNHFKKIPSTIDVDVKTNQSKLEHIPSYFMQIISLDEEFIEIAITINQIQKHKKTFFIKDNNYNISKSSIVQKITVGTGEIQGRSTISIDNNHDDLYNLGLYETKTSKHVLPNSTIQFRMLSDKNQIPPRNDKYEPGEIDISTVFTSIDNKNKKLNVYWTLPPNVFGDISYEIINNKNKEHPIIEYLPYSIPFESIPISFKIVTITEINSNIYKSNISKVIDIIDKQSYSFQQHKTRKLSLNLCSEQYKLNESGTDNGFITFLQSYLNSKYLNKIFRKYGIQKISNVNELTSILTIVITLYKAKVYQINQNETRVRTMDKKEMKAIAKYLSNWIVKKYGNNTDSVDFTPTDFQQKMRSYLQEFIGQQQ